jgi:hypothetical protein
MITEDLFNWKPKLASRSDRLSVSEIREILKLVAKPGIISFAGGIPDPDFFPAERLAAAYDRALRDVPGTALQYGVSEGHADLRAWIASYMRSRGLICDPDNILVTNGSQQAIDFCGKLFIDKDAVVAVQRPTFLAALQAFNAYEAQFFELSDEDDASDLKALAPRFAYVMADFRNPSGQTLDLEARRRLARLSRDVGMPLVEDNAYEVLRYDDDALPLLTAVAADGRHIDLANCIYIGSFSKSVAPGLRIGWMVAPRAIMPMLIMIKQGSDTHVSYLAQSVLLDVLGDDFGGRIARLREVYRERRDAMIAALEKHLQGLGRWSRPAGGFFSWVTLDPEIDTAKLLARVVSEAGVAFVPGEAFFARERQRNHMRLSFSLNPPAKIDQGIMLLGQAIQSQAAAS